MTETQQEPIWPPPPKKPRSHRKRETAKSPPAKRGRPPKDAKGAAPAPTVQPTPEEDAFILAHLLRNMVPWEIVRKYRLSEEQMYIAGRRAFERARYIAPEPPPPPPPPPPPALPPPPPPPPDPMTTPEMLAAVQTVAQQMARNRDIDPDAPAWRVFEKEAASAIRRGLAEDPKR